MPRQSRAPKSKKKFLDGVGASIVPYGNDGGIEVCVRIRVTPGGQVNVEPVVDGKSQVKNQHGCSDITNKSNLLSAYELLVRKAR